MTAANSPQALEAQQQVTTLATTADRLSDAGIDASTEMKIVSADSVLVSQ
jgi:hypothetical protein